MADLNCPECTNWDPFCRRVQREMVEHLGLDNAVISLHRHFGKNTDIDVNLSKHTDETAKNNHEHHDLTGEQLQLTMDGLTSQVKSIADVLLEDCDVCFGNITIHVKRRLLEKVVFSYSNQPHESTAGFFPVKI